MELVPVHAGDAGHHPAVARVLPVQTEAVRPGQDTGRLLQLSEHHVHVVQVGLEQRERAEVN